MKRKIIVLLIAVIFGCSVAYFMFNKRFEEDKVGMVDAMAFQVGAFTNYNNALRVAERNNGIVVQDDNIYRVYVAILTNHEAVVKMMNYYKEIGLKFYLREIQVSEDFLISVSDTEKLLISSTKDTYNIINLSVLSKYEELL